MAEPTKAGSHFSKRAKNYDRSSHWVSDPALIGKIRDLAGAGPDARVLDLATGTGKLAQAFHGKVARVVGLDLCPDMTKMGGKVWDELVMGTAEDLPFEDAFFDVCVCRQALQFMDLDRAMPEVSRVLKPGGAVVFCHLTAHGAEDKETSFLIQRLRNPARKNYFLPRDVPDLLSRHGFVDIESCDYISVESVKQWIENAAISEDAIAEIRRAYRDSSEGFKKIHAVEFKDGDIFDSFKMVIVKGRKPTPRG